MGHLPVMLKEVLVYLAEMQNCTIIDGTLGQGGHSKALLDTTDESVTIMGIDRDPTAVHASMQKLESYGDRFIPVHASYGDPEQWKPALPDKPVMGFLLDLGLSSVQLELIGRGFSYTDHYSLDMRFDESSNILSAADLVNSLPEKDLADLIYEFGEERASRKIARAIVRRRELEPFKNAQDLAKVVTGSYPSHQLKIHPATRTFQALRIAVNNELVILRTGLQAAEDILADKGRLVTISFHSLEDRIIKKYLKDRSGQCICPPGLPICNCNNPQIFRSLTRGPVIPQTEELELNPRSRSAKLRCAERVKPEGAVK